MIQALIAQHEWALLIFRLILGLIFIAHGWRKARNFAGTMSWLEGEGFRPAWLFAPLVTAAELGGGVLIALGIFTVPVAIILTINMMVAFAWNFKKKNGFFHHLELDLILIGALLLLATLGDGHYSLGASLGL